MCKKISEFFQFKFFNKTEYKRVPSTCRHLTLGIIFTIITLAILATSFMYFYSQTIEVTRLSTEVSDECEPLQRNVGSGVNARYYILNGRLEIGNRDLLESIIDNDLDQFLDKITCECTSYLASSISGTVSDIFPDVNYQLAFTCKSANMIMHKLRNYSEDPHVLGGCPSLPPNTDMNKYALAFRYNDAQEGFSEIRDVVRIANGPFLCTDKIPRSPVEALSLSISIFSVIDIVIIFFFRWLNNWESEEEKEDTSDKEKKEVTDTWQVSVNSVSGKSSAIRMEGEESFQSSSSPV
jgi:hypothetical protein